MRYLLDTNVVLDVLLERAPFVADSARIVAAVERRTVDGFLCATTVTTLYYLTAKSAGRSIAEKHIGTLLRTFQIAPVNGAILVSALDSKARDFEDAVLIYAAKAVSADAIVTRNPADFQGTKGISIQTPSEALLSL